jgi:hypothetical protein
MSRMLMHSIPSLIPDITHTNPGGGDLRLKSYELMNKLSERDLYFTMVIKLKTGLQREHSIKKLSITLSQHSSEDMRFRKQQNYCHVYWEFGLVNRFIDHSQVITTNYYNSTADFHSKSLHTKSSNSASTSHCWITGLNNGYSSAKFSLGIAG